MKAAEVVPERGGDTMTAKEWLSRAVLADERIAILEEERKRLLEAATGTGQAFADVKIQTGYGNAMEKKMAEYAEYAGEIQARKAELLKIKREIMAVIGKVSDPKAEMLLTLRYLRNLTWEKIAEIMDMSEYWVRTGLLRRALREVERILENGKWKVEN